MGVSPENFVKKYLGFSDANLHYKIFQCYERFTLLLFSTVTHKPFHN